MNPKTLDTAFSRRARLLSDPSAAARVVDGAGDGVAGLIIESFAGNLLVSTSSESTEIPVVGWLEKRGQPTYWKRLDQHQKESPLHLCGPTVQSPFLVRENGMALEISFESGYSQGVFLDQRDNRAEVRRRLKPGMTLLNTFAYTGAFSVSAALAGAETTTLDLSQPYLDWARRNFSHNALDPAQHHFCKGDTFHWLKRFARQGRRFDGIVLDPPTFSRDDKGKVFRVEKDFGELAALAASCLNQGGWLLCCTNHRGLSPSAFEKQIRTAIPRPTKTRHASMPEDFTEIPYLKSVWVE